MDDAPLKLKPGRPKTIVRDDITHIAMISYWSEGPQNVSINEICRRAKIAKPGLYREFGNEDGLQREALMRYHTLAVAPLTHIFSPKCSLAQGLDELIKFLLQDRVAAGLPNGCLLVKARQCFKELGAQTQALANEYDKLNHNKLVAWLEHRQKAGDLSKSLSISLAASYIGVQMTNALRMQEQGEPTEVIRGVTELALSVLLRQE